jgi:hypothetical protein
MGLDVLPTTIARANEVIEWSLFAATSPKKLVRFFHARFA